MTARIRAAEPFGGGDGEQPGAHDVVRASAGAGGLLSGGVSDLHMLVMAPFAALAHAIAVLQAWIDQHRHFARTMHLTLFHERHYVKERAQRAASLGARSESAGAAVAAAGGRRVLTATLDDLLRDALACQGSLDCHEGSAGSISPWPPASSARWTCVADVGPAVRRSIGREHESTSEGGRTEPL